MSTFSVRVGATFASRSPRRHRRARSGGDWLCRCILGGLPLLSVPALATGAEPLSSILLHRDPRPELAAERSTYLGWDLDMGADRSHAAVGAMDVRALHLFSDTLAAALNLSGVNRAGDEDAHVDGAVLVSGVLGGRLTVLGTVATVRVGGDFSSAIGRIAAALELPAGRGSITPFASEPVSDSELKVPHGRANVTSVVRQGGIAYSVAIGVCRCVGIQAQGSYLDSRQRRFSASADLSFRWAHDLSMLVAIGGDENPVGRRVVSTIRVGVRLGTWNELTYGPPGSRSAPWFVPLSLAYRRN